MKASPEIVLHLKSSLWDGFKSEALLVGILEVKPSQSVVLKVKPAQGCFQNRSPPSKVLFKNEILLGEDDFKRETLLESSWGGFKINLSMGGFT